MRRVNLENFKNKKSALVLSGGVVKAGAWHLGVALGLEELGFTLRNNSSPKNPDYEISTYVGSSAGSLISLFFAAGFSPRDVIESFFGGKSDGKLKPVTYKDMLSLKRPIKKPPRTKIYEPFSTFPIYIRKLLQPILSISGVFTTHGLEEYIKKNVLHSNDFKDYAADLFIVATQLDHSRKVIFSKYNYPNPRHDSTAVYYKGIPIAESIAGSMSVPPFYSPYPIFNPETEKTDYYFDGEIRETLSTHVAVDNKCEYIICSWTHTPYHFHDEIGSLINYGLPAICTQAIYLMIQKKIVTSRAVRQTAEDIIRTVHDYMRMEKFSTEHRKTIISILERKLNFNPNIHLIDIYPKHRNFQMFFRNSFSLHPDKMSEIVKLGYKRTLEVFRKHEWEN